MRGKFSFLLTEPGGGFYARTASDIRLRAKRGSIDLLLCSHAHPCLVYPPHSIECVYKFFFLYILSLMLTLPSFTLFLFSFYIPTYIYTTLLLPHSTCFHLAALLQFLSLSDTCQVKHASINLGKKVK